MPRLADLIEVLDEWYDPRTAEDWDAVGLVCGDPDEPVERLRLAVDAVPAVVDDAISQRDQLLLTHHPLLLTGVHGVPADDPKGALVHRMIRGGVAHFVAHTNADAARPGVSDALADRLGLVDTVPLRPRADADLRKLVAFVPHTAAEQVIDALAGAGAGAIGAYDRCAWSTSGTGTFRPLAGASPALGEIGRVEAVDEARVEMVVPASRVPRAVAALRRAHPYEEPAFDVLVQAPVPSRRGTGRVGLLPRPCSLADFVAAVASVLPATRWGVRAAGDPGRRVETVAVCGGSGGSLVDQARGAGADVYLTADLRHHPAVEAVTERGAGAMALVDAAHWATEAPWLDELAARLRHRFGEGLDVSVSRRVSDPWTLHAAAPAAAGPDRDVPEDVQS